MFDANTVIPLDAPSKQLMDKLARLATAVENLHEQDSDRTRDDLRHIASDVELSLWLESMRKADRAPFKRLKTTGYR